MYSKIYRPFTCFPSNHFHPAIFLGYSFCCALFCPLSNTKHIAGCLCIVNQSKAWRTSHRCHVDRTCLHMQIGLPCDCVVSCQVGRASWPWWWNIISLCSVIFNGLHYHGTHTCVNCMENLPVWYLPAYIMIRHTDLWVFGICKLKWLTL
jgi:hypothetical protein